MAKGILLKTETIHGWFHGLVTDYHYDDFYGEILCDVTWNDKDQTTETFNEYEDYDTPVYEFYHEGRWWQIHQNFYKFKQVLEG